MTLMQGSHSGHQSHSGSLTGAQQLELSLQLGNCVNYFHFYIYIR